MRKCRLIIFAKAPLAGFAKTRLIPALGDLGAAQLAKKMLSFTIENSLNANLDSIELCVTPEPKAPIWGAFKIPESILMSPQGEGDLGARLARASQRSIDAGERVILIGTDCPEITPALLHKVNDSLQRVDVVIVPATDGGYVLLGLNAFDPLLFDNVSWSTHKVFDETLHRIKNAGFTFEVFATLRDIDEADDLCWLPEGWLLGCRQEL